MTRRATKAEEALIAAALAWAASWDDPYIFPGMSRDGQAIVRAARRVLRERKKPKGRKR